MMVEEAQPSVPEELSPSHIMIGVLSERTPRVEVDEPESGVGKSLAVLQPRSLRETLKRVDRWTSRVSSLPSSLLYTSKKRRFR